MKKWAALAVSLVLLVGMAGIGGCVWRPNIAPTEPVTVEVSFPHGAPPLGQTAELICIVKARAISVRNMSLEISLPEALELAHGELSWTGNISEGDEVEVISAVVKAVKTGNWAIEVHSYFNPEEHGFYGGDGWHTIYVSISEDSAEWGIYPPWYEGGGGHEVPVVPASC